MEEIVIPMCILGAIPTLWGWIRGSKLGIGRLLSLERRKAGENLQVLGGQEEEGSRVLPTSGWVTGWCRAGDGVWSVSNYRMCSCKHVVCGK